MKNTHNWTGQKNEKKRIIGQARKNAKNKHN